MNLILYSNQTLGLRMPCRANLIYALSTAHEKFDV